jgi:[ribosomal protein S5]-alanine N-acetyltransferase
MILPEVLTTQRLILRKPEPDDAEPLYSACFANADVMRFLTWKKHAGPEESRSLLRALAERWERGTQAHWVIVLRAGRQAAGIVSLRLEPRANISYLLAQGYWRKGLMSEAAGAVCAWALEKQEIEHLWAFCDAENHSSVRSLEKIGFRQDGLRSRYAVFPNIGDEPRDCLLFTRERS